MMISLRSVLERSSTYNNIINVAVTTVLYITDQQQCLCSPATLWLVENKFTQHRVHRQHPESRQYTTGTSGPPTVTRLTDRDRGSLRVSCIQLQSRTQDDGRCDHYLHHLYRVFTMPTRLPGMEAAKRHYKRSLQVYW